MSSKMQISDYCRARDLRFDGAREAARTGSLRLALRAMAEANAIRPLNKKQQAIWDRLGRRLRWLIA